MRATLTEIRIFPVKGLPGQARPDAQLRRGAPLPGDRRWALRLPQSPLDPARPGWASKRHFLQGVNQPQTMAQPISWQGLECGLWQGRPFDLMAQPQGFLDQARTVFAQPDLQLFGPCDWLTDQEQPLISLINSASVAALAEASGRPVDAQRFRGNLLIDGLSAWEEAGWLGRELQLGEARLHVVAPIDRCEAPGVNLATGRRDLAVLDGLRGLTGAGDCGLFLDVIHPGRIARGDALGWAD